MEFYSNKYNRKSSEHTRPRAELRGIKDSHAISSPQYFKADPAAVCHSVEWTAILESDNMLCKDQALLFLLLNVLTYIDKNPFSMLFFH